MTKIYIDIETLPSGRMPGLDEMQAPKNYKDEKKIQAWKEDKQEDVWRKEALVSHQGRILCIGYAINDQDACCLYDGLPDEEIVMIELDNVLHQFKDVQFVGKSTSFDVLFIYQRALKYRCLNILQHLNPRQKRNIFDITYEFGNWVDYRYMVSLDNMAKFFNLPSSKGEVTGANVFDHWRMGNHSKILKYCIADVELTRQLFLLMDVSDDVEI